MLRQQRRNRQGGGTGPAEETAPPGQRGIPGPVVVLSSRSLSSQPAAFTPTFARSLQPALAVLPADDMDRQCEDTDAHSHGQPRKRQRKQRPCFSCDGAPVLSPLLLPRSLTRSVQNAADSR